MSGRGEDSDLDRCVIGLLKIAGRDPRIIKIATGAQVPNFRANWSSRQFSRGSRTPDRAEMEWRLATGSNIPTNVFRAALETLIEHPVANEEILRHLQSLQRRVTRASDPGNEPIRLLNQAIAGMETATKKQPGE